MRVGGWIDGWTDGWMDGDVDVYVYVYKMFVMTHKFTSPQSQASVASSEVSALPTTIPRRFAMR